MRNYSLLPPTSFVRREGRGRRGERREEGRRGERRESGEMEGEEGRERGERKGRAKLYDSRKCV